MAKTKSPPKRKKNTPKEKKTTESRSNRYNAYHRQYMESRREQDNEIGPLPPVANPKRKERCRTDFQLFCNTYLKDNYFFRPWSKAQVEIAKNVERVIGQGGNQAIAHKRRGAKTTICLAGMLWSALYGKHMYSYFVTAAGGTTDRAKDFFKTELYTNDLLLADFPEVCYPIRKTKRIMQRKVTYCGYPCEVHMSGDDIELPTMRIMDANGKVVIGKNKKPLHHPASGVKICFFSTASGGARGGFHPLEDRKSARPSLALVDDPQNDGTARSFNEITKLEEFLSKTLEPMSGYEESGLIKPPSILVTCTCIQPNDLACRLIDRKENPTFNGILFRRFFEMPNPIPQLWFRYKELFQAEGGSRAKPCKERDATKFYLKHRKEMDAGFVVDDENDYEPFQVSAIQYGMDCWCANERMFWCEHQNDPEMAIFAGSMELSPKKILREKILPFMTGKRRISSRRWIPDNTEFLTGFIDVGRHYLNYEITAFGKDYSFAHVVDFGYWPDQGGWHKIRKANYNVDLQKHYKTGSQEEKIAFAVRDCLTHIFSNTYYDQVGQPANIHDLTDWQFGSENRQARRLALVGVDARDHAQEYAVWMGIAMFHDQSRNDFPILNRACPCYGEGTKSKHMRDYDLEMDEWQRGRERFNRGEGDWIENPITKSATYEKFKSGVPFSLMWEVDTYRTLRDNGWNTAIGLSGSQTLFDDLPEILTPYAEQQCAMVADFKQLYGSLYRHWAMRKPALYDKEFFDTNSGSWMIASYVGMNPEISLSPETEEEHYETWMQKLKNRKKEKDSFSVPRLRRRSLR